MAVYDSGCKIIIGNISDGTEATTGSLAKKINDFVVTLDSTSQTIIAMNTVRLAGHTVAVIILYK